MSSAPNYLTHLVQHRNKYYVTPLIRTPVIRTANNPERLGPSGKFVQNSTNLIFLETAGYPIKYSTVLWLLELQIRRGRKVQTQVHTVNSNSRLQTVHVAYFQRKIQLSGFSAHPNGSPSQLIRIIDFCCITTRKMSNCDDTRIHIFVYKGLVLGIRSVLRITINYGEFPT